MITEVTFPLTGTDVWHFLQMLRVQVARLGTLRFPASDRGYYSLELEPNLSDSYTLQDLARANRRGELTAWTASIYAVYNTRESERRHDRTKHNAIVFGVTARTVNSLVVTAQLNAPEVADGFSRLLREISELASNRTEAIAAMAESDFQRTLQMIISPDEKAAWDSVLSTMRSRQRVGDVADKDDVVESPYPTWFPKTPDYREKWRLSYLVICDLRWEYEQAYEVESAESPKPTWEEYKDALLKMPNDTWRKKPSVSTIRRIIRAGDKGWLEKRSTKRRRGSS